MTLFCFFKAFPTFEYADVAVAKPTSAMVEGKSISAIDMRSFVKEASLPYALCSPACSISSSSVSSAYYSTIL